MAKPSWMTCLFSSMDLIKAKGYCARLARAALTRFAMRGFGK